jgi:DNA-binding CsgD family transcriptional regulator
MKPDVFRVGATLAVLGRPASVEEVRLATGLSSKKLADALSDLDDADIAKRDPGYGLHRIVHPIFQSAFLRDLSETRKSQIHSEIFEALHSRSDRASSAEVAYHAVRSLRQPSNLGAVLEEAAKEAESMGSYAESANWYGRLAEVAQDRSQKFLAQLGKANAIEHFDAVEAASVYGELLTTTPDPDHIAQCLLGRARALRMAGRPLEAIADLKKAESLAKGDLAIEVRDASAVIQAAMGEVQQAEAFFTTLEMESRGTPVHATALIRLGSLAYFSGRIQEAKSWTNQALEVAPDNETRRYASVNVAWFECLLGHWPQAETILEISMREASRSSDIWLLIPMMTSAGVLAAWKGEFDRAWDLGSQALRLTSAEYLLDRLNALAVLGLTLLEAGNSMGALEVLAPVPQLVNRSSEKNEVHQSLIILGECLLDCGNVDGARETLELLRGVLPFNPSWEVAADRLEGQVSLSVNPMRAIELGQRWLSKPADIPFEQARLEEVIASASYALGQRAEAIEGFRSARAIYGKLGARSRFERCVSWLEAHTPGRRGRPRSMHPAHLTKRELEVLQLVVQGLRNDQIAAQLFISSGTVRKHIENIKMKAGVKRRSDLIPYGRALMASTSSASA